MGFTLVFELGFLFSSSFDSKAAAKLSYQLLEDEKECEVDKAQRKYEFCAGDFMRMLQLMEIGTDNDRICQYVVTNLF